MELNNIYLILITLVIIFALYWLLDCYHKNRRLTEHFQGNGSNIDPVIDTQIHYWNMRKEGVPQEYDVEKFYKLDKDKLVMEESILSTGAEPAGPTIWDCICFFK